MSAPENLPAPIPLSPIGAELRPEWSMHLVIDVALRASEESILEAHDLQHHQLQQIMLNPTFVMQVEKLRKDLEKEGATFKLKCQLQADAYLAEVHKKIMSPDTDEKVFTRLVEDVVRWGGLEPGNVPNGGAGAMGGLSINISFGQHAKRGVTIDAEPS
jgi:hypothetical protein